MKKAFVGALAALALTLGVVTTTVQATDPSLSNVPDGQYPDMVVYTVSDDVRWFTTDCTLVDLQCRTSVFYDEQSVVDWVRRLQLEYWVEYLS